MRSPLALMRHADALVSVFSETLDLAESAVVGTDRAVRESLDMVAEARRALAIVDLRFAEMHVAVDEARRLHGSLDEKSGRLGQVADEVAAMATAGRGVARLVDALPPSARAPGEQLRR